MRLLILTAVLVLFSTAEAQSEEASVSSRAAKLFRTAESAGDPEADRSDLDMAEILRSRDATKTLLQVSHELARLGPEVLPILCEKARTRHPSWVRRAALDALEELRAPGTLSCLTEIALDERLDINVRRDSVPLLGRLGGSSQAQTLRRLTDAADLLIPGLAVEALGLLPEGAGLPHLRALLHSRNSMVRSRAAQSLGEQGDHSSIQALIKCLGDSDPYVRAFAQGALRELTFRNAIYDGLRPGRQKRDWESWWSSRRDHSSRRLAADGLRDNLKLLENGDSGEALEALAWFRETTYQEDPLSPFQWSLLFPLLRGGEAEKWRNWVRKHGAGGRPHWFALAVERLLARLESEEDLRESWEALSALRELIGAPESRPYLYWLAWKHEAPETRREVARAHRRYWEGHKDRLLPPR